MKTLFYSEPKWRSLLGFIQNHLGQEVITPPRNLKPTSRLSAVIKIQQFWRKCKLKQMMVKNFYDFHLAMFRPGDKLYYPSSLLFGRHVAEIGAYGKYHVHNPFIAPEALYYRNDNIHPVLLNKLLRQFCINQHSDFFYIPISLVACLPIEKVLVEILVSAHQEVHSFSIMSNKEYRSHKDKLASDQIIIVTHPQQAMGILIISKTLTIKEKIRSTLVSYGLFASAWMVAFTLENNDADSQQKPMTINYESYPSCKHDLLDSEQFFQLKSIANQEKYCTRLLAKNLVKIIEALPELTDVAVQRIALIMDLTNTFFANHYARFSLTVYSVIHEISLGLMNCSQDYMRIGFEAFEQQSMQSFTRALGISEQRLKNCSLLSLPTLSGASAFAVSIDFAKNISRHARVKVYKPCYFEFENVIESVEDADILLISAGAIVSLEGLWPGLNVNAFIKKHILAVPRPKPCALIVDCTTALYKNLKLDDEVIDALAQGQFSLFIFESHQKFGLLHSDQAQYGRIFAICSQHSFSKELVESYRLKAWSDYQSHLDIRIGAFLDYSCGDLLEVVKSQHFSNGDVIRDMYSSILNKKEYLLSIGEQTTDDLYFVSSRDQSILESCRHIEFRDSFGHFVPTRVVIGHQLRISPDASDTLDSLLFLAELFLVYHYQSDDLIKIMQDKGNAKQAYSLAEQVIILAMLHVISEKQTNPLPYGFASLAYDLLMQLERIKDRRIYQEVYHFLSKSKQYQDLQTLIKNRRLLLGTKELALIVKNRYLTHALLKLRHIDFDQSFFQKICSLSQERLMSIIDNLNRNPFIVVLLAHWQQKGMVFSANALIACIGQFVLENHPAALSDFSTHRVRLEHIPLVQALDEVRLNYLNYLVVLNEPKFFHHVMSIHTQHSRCIQDLSSEPSIQQQVLQVSQSYRLSCYRALASFVSKQIDRHELKQALDLAKSNYLNISPVNTSTVYWLIRSLLMIIINVIAGFTLGLAHYINYKMNHQILYWFKERDYLEPIKITHDNISDELLSEEQKAQQVGL